MNIDWTTVLTHLMSLLIGGAGGYALKSFKINSKTINKTEGERSPIFSNKGDVKIRDFGDKNDSSKK